MKKVLGGPLLIVVIAVISGCSAFRTVDTDPDPEAAGQTAKVDIHGPFPVVYREGIETIKLIELLAGEEEGRRIATLPSSGNQGVAWATKYDHAFTAFYARFAGDVNVQKLERNRIQDRMLGASDQRCRVFKVNLQRDQSRSNFWLGTLATVSGALGAVTGGIQSAKNLAATAGVLTGVRAEYNQDFYANLLFSVITRGIDERRKEAFRQIQQEGQRKSIAAYSMQGAVRDALLYDGLCNTGVGLEQAQESIRLSSDPGIDALNRMLVKANLTRAIIDEKITTLSDLEKAGTDLKAGTLTAKISRVEFGTHLDGEEELNFSDIAVFVRAEKTKVETGISEAARKIKLPSTLPDSEHGALRQKVRVEVNGYRDQLFQRVDACIKTDVADGVKNLIVTRNTLSAATNDQARDTAEANLKGEEAKLHLVMLRVRQLFARFSVGQKSYFAGLDKTLVASKDTTAKSISVDVPQAIKAVGTGPWDFGKPSNCDGK